MASQQKITLEIPPELPRPIRRQIADDVIEYIVDRTTKGKDWRGKPFPKYSDSYIKSLDFKIAGKSKKVDLQLSGDMLAAIELLKDAPGKIEIGFAKGDEINGRAEGNILGSYGGEPNPKRARDFLGILPKDLEKIIDRYA